MRIARPALVVGVVCLALIFAPALASPARAADDGRFNAKDVKSFIRQAAKAGIGTYRPGARKPIVRVRKPRSPVRLTADLARSAALGVFSHTGMTAGQLNDMTGPARMRKARVPTGALVVVWVKRGRTRSARLARELLGPVDYTRYEQIVLPSAVMMLFSSDLAQRRSKRAVGRRASSARSAPALLAAADPCSATQNVIENTINRVFDAIGRIKADRALLTRIFGRDLGPAIADLGDLLGLAATEAGRYLVLGVVRIPLRVVAEAVAGVAATIGVIGQVANAVLPWSGQVSVDRNPTSFGILTGVPGLLTLDVSAPGSSAQWPEWVRGCAQLLGITLPTTTPKDAEVRWDLDSQVPAGLVTPLSGKGTLDERGRSQLAFLTGSETPEVARGPVREGRVNVMATVQRRDLDRLIHRLSGELLRPIPKIIRDHFGAQIRGAIASMLSEIKRKISAVRDVSTAMHFGVLYHEPPKPDPDPQPPPLPPPNGVGVFREYTQYTRFMSATCAIEVGGAFTLHATQDGWTLDVRIANWQGFGATYPVPLGGTEPVVTLRSPDGHAYSSVNDPFPYPPGPTGGSYIYTKAPDRIEITVYLWDGPANATGTNGFYTGDHPGAGGGILACPA